MNPYHWSGIVRQSALFLVGITLLSVFSGVFLESNLRLLVSFPSILLIIPAFIDACGDISSTFAARLTSSLRLGLFNFRKKRKRIFVNVEATLALTLIFFAFISVLSYMISALIGLPVPGIWEFFFAVMVSSFIVTVVCIAMAVVVAYVGIKRGLDPDNFEAPLLSTFSDLVGVFIFINICRIIFIGG